MIQRETTYDLIWQAEEKNNTSKLRDYLYDQLGGPIEVNAELFDWAVTNAMREYNPCVAQATNRKWYVHWSLCAKIVDTILTIEGIRRPQVADVEQQLREVH